MGNDKASLMSTSVKPVLVLAAFKVILDLGLGTGFQCVLNPLLSVTQLGRGWTLQSVLRVPKCLFPRMVHSRWDSRFQRGLQRLSGSPEGQSPAGAVGAMEGASRLWGLCR